MHDPSHAHSLTRILASKTNDRTCVVCFSGGLDSGLVLAACKRAGIKTIALLAVGPSLPMAERLEAIQFAAWLDVELVEIEAGETDRSGYRANSGDRCYHCKTSLYQYAEDLASRQWPDAVILNGSQVDDLVDFRPGMKAGKEHGIISPLVEAGMGKEEIRALAREWSLPIAEKPASPCLGSRFPVGTEITPERLAQVEAVEAFLRAHSLWPARARWHGSVVRLEIDRTLMALVLEEPLRTELERVCWKAGFRFPALDLAGIQSGSLSHAIPEGGRNQA